jgi:glycosyltransferase involved in cell wall biosynthesis
MDRTLRIALVLAGPYPAGRGSQVLVQHLADGLGERGHEIHLVTYGIMQERPGPRLGRLLRDAVLVLRLWRVVRRHRIDVIHAHNYEAAIAGLLVARAAGCALVYHGHNALAEELPTYFAHPLAYRLAHTLGRLLDEHVPRRADFCIAVTEELGAILRRRGVASEELACISPTGSPRELGSLPAASAPTGLVCYAGNLDRYQNLDFLLAAFARVRATLPAARLVLVTHGDPGHARGRLRQSHDGVEVIAARSFEEARARLASADVAVCPRTERSGFPMKLLNYMAAGKAIVASAGSAKGLHDGVTGLVVPDGDVDAFAAAMIDLLGDAEMRVRLGAAARRAVENRASWDAVLDRIESIYHQVVVRTRTAVVPLACAE